MADAVARARRAIFTADQDWTGPHPEDLDASGQLKAPVPEERWPYGSSRYHEAGCRLHEGGLFCDCAASDASDEDFGGAP